MVWVGVFVLFLGSGAWAWASYFKTYHFSVVDEGVLLRSGNRGVKEFETGLRRGGVKTVVCLVDDKELADPEKGQFAAEMEGVKKMGVKMVRIPVRLGGWPTTEDVRRFLDICAVKQNRPVLVHCAQGVRRTGMFVAAYQESVMGWDAAKVKGEMLTFGHSERTVKDVERFVSVYDGKERRMTEVLEMSKEE